MSSQPQPPPSTLHERFAASIQTLCETIADQGVKRRIAFPLLWLVSHRIMALCARFLRRAERGPRAKTPPAKPCLHPNPEGEPTEPASAGPASAAPAPTKRAPPRPPKNWPAHCFGPPPRLPCGFAWLRRIVPGDLLRAYAEPFAALLSDPELVGQLARDPALGRFLRPLCHMIGIKPPRHLQRPPPDPAQPRPKRPQSQVTHPKTPPRPSDIYQPGWVNDFTYIPGVKNFTA